MHSRSLRGNHLNALLKSLNPPKLVPLIFYSLINHFHLFFWLVLFLFFFFFFFILFFKVFVFEPLSHIVMKIRVTV
jgi:hypothetical protein